MTTQETKDRSADVLPAPCRLSSVLSFTGISSDQFSVCDGVIVDLRVCMCECTLEVCIRF